MIQLTIDGRVIEASPGQTVLEAARSHGLIIPTLCDHPDLTPVGSCRLCVVEVEGWRGQVTACTQMVREGFVIRTETPNLERSRRTVLELLLRHYHDAGYAANDRGETEFEHWVQHYHAQPPARFRYEAHDPIDGDPNPFVRVDLNKCILCTRCVRACAEIKGRFVWGVGRRGAETRIIAGSDTTMLEARYESCSACVTYRFSRCTNPWRSSGPWASPSTPRACSMSSAWPICSYC